MGFPEKGCPQTLFTEKPHSDIGGAGQINAQQPRNPEANLVRSPLPPAEHLREITPPLLLEYLLPVDPGTTG